MNIFEKIIANEIPSYKVYEDELVLAFLDVNPSSKGHMLVIPKCSCVSILDCPEKEYLYVMKIVQKLAKKAMDIFKADGVNVLTNALETAEQSVPHFHVHIIPRYKDGVKSLFVNYHEQGNDLQQIAKLFKEN